jgi:hypothetical protein
MPLPVLTWLTPPQNIHVIADLAILILQQQMDRKSFSRKHPGKVYLPPSLFRQPQDREISSSQSHLPLGFQLASKKTRFDTILNMRDTTTKEVDKDATVGV